jgi:proteasome lid subunit RPN8/RPN11
MIRIPESIYRRMVEHARKEKPLECCGFLGGRNQTAQEILEIENVARSPILFSMETKEERMVAIYHSHPCTVPFRVL